MKEEKLQQMRAGSKQGKEESREENEKGESWIEKRKMQKRLEKSRVKERQSVPFGCVCDFTILALSLCYLQ